MKIFFTFLLALCFAAVGWGQVSIHCWDFNSADNFTSPISTNHRVTGNGAITHNLSAVPVAFGGSTANACTGSPAGNALCPQPGAALVNNDKHIDFLFPTTGYTDIVFSFWFRRTDTGFDNNVLQYSTNGGSSYTDFTTFTFGTGTAGTTLTYDFSAITAANNNPDFRVRIVLKNGTNATGNNRYDNVKMTGNPCPGIGAPTFNISDNDCPSTEGTIAATGCGPGTVVEYSLSDMGPWSPTPPAYSLLPLTVYARCRNTTTNCTSSVVSTTTAPNGCGPANDLCINAISLVCGQTVMGANTGATDAGQPTGFCGSTNINMENPGVWYTFQGTGDMVTLSTCSPNTDFDNAIIVFSGTCDNLVCVNANDDANCGFSSQVGFISQAGVTYYILVNGFGGGAGNFEISVNCTPVPGCGDTWYDFGGPNGNYFDDDNTVYTFCPDQPGDVVTVTFTQFDTEADYDFMRVFDGDNTTAPALHTGDGFSGSTIPGPFTSTHPSGCLTFNFVSDNTDPLPGWAADITCSTPACEIELTCPQNIVTGANAGLCQWNSPAGSLTPGVQSVGCSSVNLTWEIDYPADAPAANATVAEWTFENAAKRVAPNLPYTADAGIPANVNTAPITLAGGPLFTAWVQGSGGGGTFAPNSNTWTAAGDKYWQIVLNTTGYDNLTLSSKQQSSNTGPRNFQVEYSLNGSTWTAVPGAAIVAANNFTSGVLNNVPLPAACDNQPTLYLRWLQVGTTAVNGSPVAATGTNRIDDVRITAAAPTSGTGDASGAAFPLGVSTVTYTATGNSGEPETCSFTVTVSDNQPPTITCPGAQIVALDGSCSAVVPDYRFPGTANDNCGVATLTQTPAPGSIVSGPGVFLVTLSASDMSGNSASCSFNVTKVDFTPPVLTCFNPTVTFNGEASLLLNVNSLASATDNCGVPTISISPTGISCDQVGQTVPVTVTAMDPSNNTSTCTSNVTVTGLPCGWSQQPNGVNCANGNSIGYNAATGIWTATSTNCFYGPGFTSDQMAFAQRTLCGDGSITAQVTDISGTALGWAGVIMRESNAAGAKKAQLMTNLSNLSRREFRVTTNGAANPQQFPSQDRYWLRLVRAGNQFSMYVSPNGAAWYFVGAQNIPMNACIQVGLVATNYQQTSTVTATFANVSFTGSNVPPLTGASTPLNTLNELTTDASTSLSITRNSQQISDFQVYPNPTGGELNVNLAQYLGRDVRVEVYSLTGQLLRLVEIEEVQTTVEQLDLSAFQSGMYLVKVKSEGLPDATKRVVLAR